MEVNPDELVKLAAQSQSAAQVLSSQWAEAKLSLAVAHDSLGDSPAAGALADTYDTATSAADQVVKSLSQVLMNGVQALEQAAYDAREADDKATEAFLSVRDSGADDGKSSGKGHGNGHGKGGH